MANVTSLDFANATVCLGKLSLAAGTTTTLYAGAATAAYAIQGKLYSKTVAANTATPTTDGVALVPGTTTAAAFTPILVNQGSVFVVCYDASGTLKVTQGQVAALDSAGNFINTPQFPDVPTEAASYHGGAIGPMCPVGYIIVKVASGGATWTFGASNLAGPPANTTITYADFMALPGRPQAA